jgi:hypothetical protein
MKMQLTDMASHDRMEFSKFSVIVGRDSTADIPLADPTLPPYQCMIGEGADDGAVVWNLRDDFPLYVNGRRVTKAKLFPGDILTIGQNRFVFSCEAGLLPSGGRSLAPPSACCQAAYSVPPRVPAVANLRSGRVDS